VATYTKVKLSGSTDGRAIKVVATSIGSGTTIHTGSSTATTYDEIWLYAQNTDTSAVKLTIGWGGTTDPDDLIEVTVQPEAGLVCIAPGLLIKGNATTALIVKAAAASANVITIHGFVNQITA
jgi:hypothetical protein